MTQTLSLGPLSMVAEQHGPLLTITIHAPSDTAPVGRMTLTVAEWTALVALVDCMGAADREIARLRNERDEWKACAARTGTERRSDEMRAIHDADSLRQQVRELTEERDAYRTDTAMLAEIVGIDPTEPGERRLLDEVAMHVRATFESHRRLAHDLSAALVSVDAMGERIEELTKERAALRCLISSARAELGIAGSYKDEPGIAIGLRIHARRCAEVCDAIDTALAHTASEQGKESK